MRYLTQGFEVTHGGGSVLSLPFSVNLLSSVTLTSISASCHTEAQDLFIGTLFTEAIALLAFGIT